MPFNFYRSTGRHFYLAENIPFCHKNTVNFSAKSYLVEKVQLRKTLLGW